MLDGDGVGACVEVGQSFVLRHGGAVDGVRGGDRAGRVEDLEAEVAEGMDGGGAGGGWRGGLAGPALEAGVVGDAALQRDGFVLGAHGRLLGAVGFGGGSEGAERAEGGDGRAIP